MNDITITDNGAALVDGTEYPIYSFDMDGNEAITIPALDLISYDEGDAWRIKIIMKNKTYLIQTEDRYGRSDEYEVQASNKAEAEAIANKPAT